MTGEIVSDNDDDEELEQARSEDSVEEDSEKIYFLKAQRAEILKGKIFFLNIQYFYFWIVFSISLLLDLSIYWLLYYFSFCYFCVIFNYYHYYQN